MPKRRARFVALTELIARQDPPISVEAIAGGRVLVDGRVITNTSARVRVDAAIRLLPDTRLRGDIKLSYALDVLDVSVSGCVCVDVGASAGGFTTALLDRGAARVYAVDVGVGQLLGSLRADPRVVNLEGHNVGSLTSRDFGDVADILTVDLSYLSLADVIPQIEAIPIRHGADVIALVKPMFELRRATPPSDRPALRSAVDVATSALTSNGWAIVTDVESPNRGRKGAIEFFIHARRTAPTKPP